MRQLEGLKPTPWDGNASLTRSCRLPLLLRIQSDKLSNTSVKCSLQLFQLAHCCLTKSRSPGLLDFSFNVATVTSKKGEIFTSPPHKFRVNCSKKLKLMLSDSVWPSWLPLFPSARDQHAAVFSHSFFSNQVWTLSSPVFLGAMKYKCALLLPSPGLSF